MLGSEYPWLAGTPRSSQSAPRRASRVAFPMLTLVVAVVALLTVLVLTKPESTTAVNVAAPAKLALEEPVASAWPLTLFRLWVLVPHLARS